MFKKNGLLKILISCQKNAVLKTWLIHGSIWPHIWEQFTPCLRQKKSWSDTFDPRVTKEFCNRGHGLSRSPRAWILPFWSKTDMDSLKQNLCLAPDQKMVTTKKVANDQKNYLAFVTQLILTNFNWKPTKTLLVLPNVPVICFKNALWNVSIADEATFQAPPHAAR